MRRLTSEVLQDDNFQIEATNEALDILLSFVRLDD